MPRTVNAARTGPDYELGHILFARSYYRIRILPEHFHPAIAKQGREALAFLPGTQIRDVHNPGRLGIITSSPSRDRPSGRQVQVLWTDQSVSYEYETALELAVSNAYLDPFELIKQGKYGRANDLRRNMTFVHLSGRLANMVYSLGVTNTDFYPHQYRPLLTLLDSPTNGILIADEVGLGKTIEAGLIWTEYRARYNARRLLIVCPAVLREKWRDELNLRFGVQADIVNAAQLLEALQKNHGSVRPEQAWIVSYNAVRPPRRSQNDQQSPPNIASPSSKLAGLFTAMEDDTPLIDMVIFDEAHYMRNRETAAWKLGESLKGVSEFQVMLSATPINLRNADLFSLLNLLDPDHFAALDDLERLIAANKSLIRARDLVLDLRSTTAELNNALSDALQEPLLSKSLQLANMIDDLPSEEQFQDKRTRAALAETLERISLLSHVLTRTRKRDVQAEHVQRRVFRNAVAMSDVERHIYDLVTTEIRQYAASRGIGSGFLLSMPQRQVASSPAALIRAWQDSRYGQDAKSIEELDDEQDDTSPNFRPLREHLRATILPQVDLKSLERNDSKVGSLVGLLKEALQRSPFEKAIVFTTFRPTALYLMQRLEQFGIEAVIVWGNQRTPKHQVIEDFRRSQTCRVLIATEVAAEGVDLQFCQTLINFDLPWNPTRVEQRIGRIDRLGQKAKYINVVNMHFADTIDDRIVTRLLERLEIFREALGETEAVVGEEVSKLEYQLLSQPLTKDEEDRLIDRAAMAIENVARQRDALEQNAAHMMAHGQRVLERISAAQVLKRSVSDQDLWIYVHDYLVQYWPGHQFTANDSDPKRVTLRLPPALAAQFDDFIKEQGVVSQTRLAHGTARPALFRNNITAAFHGDAEVIHQFHPLIAFITKDLKKRQEHYYPLVAIRIGANDVSEPMEAGLYAFYSTQWRFAGAKQEEWLATAIVNTDGLRILTEDITDGVMQAARVYGKDWLGSGSELCPDAVHAAVDRAEAELDARFRDAVKKKKSENVDRVTFQLQSVARHESRRLLSFKQIELNHLANNRPGLAKATQGKQRVLKEKMEQRRAVINSHLQIQCTRHFVCAGILHVE